MAEATYSPNNDFNSPINGSGGGISRNGYFGYIIANSATDNKLATGAVKVQALGKRINTAATTAYPFYQHLKTLPLIGEVVYIISGPSPGDQLRGAPTDYYLAAVNLWNNPQAGISSVANQVKQPGKEWRATPDNNPLLPFEGDIILEGRKGQSIRFSESLRGTPWQGNRANLSTIAITSGIYTTGNASEYVTEDINADAASIYLLQGQSIPLTVQHEWKHNGLSSYGSSVLPQDAKSYTGNQVVLNSDRIYLNSKTEHVLISAQQHVGVLGDQVHLDAIRNINFAAPVLNLTSDSLKPELRQAAVKGSKLALELKALYSALLPVLLTISDSLNTQDLPVDTVETLIDEIKTKLRPSVDNPDLTVLESNILSKHVYLS